VIPVHFDHPWILIGLAVFVPVFIADRLSARRKRIAAALPAGMRLRLSVTTFLSRLSIVFLIVAVSGPRWGEGRADDEPRRAVDVVFAVDVSRSMEVPDGLGEYLGPGSGPTRLERALDILIEAASSSPGTRFAAAVSRGRGVLAVPLTWDADTVVSFLHAMRDSAMTGRGTNLQSLLEAAGEAFATSRPSRRIVVLASDGEELSGSLRSAAERLGREGTAVVALALGSTAGGTFPGGGDSVSRRDSSLMRMAAAETGGLYVDGSLDDAAARLSAFINEPAPSSSVRGSGGNGRNAPRWLAFAVLSLASFAAAKACLLGNGRRGKRKEAAT